MDPRRGNEEYLDGRDCSVPGELWRLPQLLPPPYHALPSSESDLRSSAAMSDLGLMAPAAFGLVPRASDLCLMAPTPWKPSSINTNTLGAAAAADLLGDRFEQIMRSEQRRDAGPIPALPGIYSDYTDRSQAARISWAASSSGNYPCGRPASYLHPDMTLGAVPTSPSSTYLCAHPASYLDVHTDMTLGTYAAAPNCSTYQHAHPASYLDVHTNMTYPRARPAYHLHADMMPRLAAGPTSAPSSVQIIGARPSLQDVRSELAVDPSREGRELLHPRYSEHIVRLLEEGAGDILRLSVLDAVKRNAHRIMLHQQGTEVFKALVRCCEDRHEELVSIVQAVVHPNPRRHQVGLRRLLTDDSRWVDCMKMLIAVVSKHNSRMCDMIVECMKREDLDVISIGGGHNLLSYCVSTLNCLQIESLVKHAVEGIDKNLQSRLGCNSLEVCLDNAREDQLRQFEITLLAPSTEITTYHSGSCIEDRQAA